LAGILRKIRRYDEEYVPIIDPETAEDLGLVIAIIVAVLGAIDLLFLGYWYYRRS